MTMRLRVVLLLAIVFAGSRPVDAAEPHVLQAAQKSGTQATLMGIHFRSPHLGWAVGTGWGYSEDDRRRKTMAARHKRNDLADHERLFCRRAARMGRRGEWDHSAFKRWRGEVASPKQRYAIAAVWGLFSN